MKRGRLQTRPRSASGPSGRRRVVLVSAGYRDPDVGSSLSAHSSSHATQTPGERVYSGFIHRPAPPPRHTRACTHTHLLSSPPGKCHSLPRSSRQAIPSEKLPGAHSSRTNGFSFWASREGGHVGGTHSAWGMQCVLEMGGQRCHRWGPTAHLFTFGATAARHRGPSRATTPSGCGAQAGAVARTGRSTWTRTRPSRRRARETAAVSARLPDGPPQRSAAPSAPRRSPGRALLKQGRKDRCPPNAIRREFSFS